MQLMSWMIGRLGSRFGLMFEPYQRRVMHSAMGRFLDRPLDLAVGLVEPDGTQRVLPFTTDNDHDGVEQFANCEQFDRINSVTFPGLQRTLRAAFRVQRPQRVLSAEGPAVRDAGVLPGAAGQPAESIPVGRAGGRGARQGHAVHPPASAQHGYQGGWGRAGPALPHPAGAGRPVGAAPADRAVRPGRAGDRRGRNASSRSTPAAHPRPTARAWSWRSP